MQGDPDGLLTLIWSILLASFVMLNLTFVGAIARDGASISGRAQEKR